MYFVYVLQSLDTGRFYIGQTDDLLIRFQQHASGQVRSTIGGHIDLDHFFSGTACSDKLGILCVITEHLRARFRP